MNYKKHYNRLIKRAQDRSIDQSVYTERHHIIPKCMGGSDTSENIVNLLPEEHYVTHQLLVKMYPEHAGLKYALYKMTMTNDKVKRNNREYKWVRKQLSIANKIKAKIFWRNNTEQKEIYSKRTKEQWKNMSEDEYSRFCEHISKRQQGSNNTFFGKKHTKKTKSILSKRRKSFYENMSDNDYKSHPQTVSVSINGEIIHGLSRAGKKYGIGASLVRYRCLSKTNKWKDWFYIK